MHTYVPAHTHKHAFTGMHLHIYVPAHICNCTHIHNFTHMCLHIYVPARLFTFSQYTHLHTCTRTNMYLHTYATAHTYTPLHTCTCIYMCTCIHMHICIHMSTHITQENMAVSDKLVAGLVIVLVEEKNDKKKS